MNKIVFSVLIAGLFSCNSKKDSSFVVEGNIKNATAQTIFLEEDKEGSQQPVVVDSAHLQKDGSFTLSTIPKEETLYSLREDHKDFPFALLINDTRKLHVDADLSNKSNPYSVKGSPATEGLLEYDHNSDLQAQKIALAAHIVDSLSKARTGNSSITDSTINSYYSPFAEGVEQLKNYTLDFLNKSTSPVLTIYALGAYQQITGRLGVKGFTNPELIDMINTASAKFPADPVLKDLKNKLKPHKAEDFTLPDTSGHPVALSSFRGKYVLVDFWASWCGPCRMENPNVVRTYNQYRDKNFTVLGVSLDQSKDAWMKAIKDDGLAWTQISDLKFWNNAAAALYNVNSIPYNFLIDPNGNIIAENIRGEDLQITLSKTLK